MSELNDLEYSYLSQTTDSYRQLLTGLSFGSLKTEEQQLRMVLRRGCVRNESHYQSLLEIIKEVTDEKYLF